MANVDKKQIDEMMKIISQSMIWAMPLNTPSDYAAHSERKTDSTKPIKKNRARKPVSIKTFGTIKKASVKKVNAMIDTYLNKGNSVDTVVIAIGSNVEKFGKEKLGVDFQELEEGKKIPGMRGIQIFIAENQIDTLLPSVLMTLNEYMKTH